jgi:hypothetical protein
MIDLPTRHLTDGLSQNAQVFRPYAYRRQQKALAAGTRFVHYTSAPVGLEILRRKEVWLRNSQVMNDFSEVLHGERCLLSVWEDLALRNRLGQVLDQLEAGLLERLSLSYRSWVQVRERETFLISMSEHGDPTCEVDEDRFGRLSMWRAYGGSTNVALVVNGHAFLAPSDAIPAYTSPVLYTEVDGFKAHFRELVEVLEDNVVYLKELGADAVLCSLFYALHDAALSTKHPGFAEEREWRILYSPFLFGSGRLYPEIETVAGVPQKVFKLPLQNYPDEGLTGVDVLSLIDRVIIGPSQFPLPIFEAYALEFEKLGVSDPQSRIAISEIPIRR